MLKFYTLAIKSLLGLIIASALISYFCLSKASLKSSLLGGQSPYRWTPKIGSDLEVGGFSTIKLNHASDYLNYEFNIQEGAEYPYATLELAFVNKKKRAHPINLSKYSTLTYQVKCYPNQTLTFGLKTVDQKIDSMDDPKRYPITASYFSCSDEWSSITIDLQHLNIPNWWLTFYKVELSSEEYFIDNVLGLTFGISPQTKTDTLSNIKIKVLELAGRDNRFIYLLLALLVTLWALYLYWLFKEHSKALIFDVKESLNNDRPLIAYQQLTIEPQKDKGKSALLRLMAMEYANPELSLEFVSTSLGINRTKVNEILKEELGITFSVYLNKLRLTESARLLINEEEVNVAEIAYSVGYNNVPYFNKLFKSKYGCTPKKFKLMSHSDSF